MSITDTLKEALYSIKVLKQELASQQSTNFMPIAVIGISCRFPEANGKDEFWKLLSNKGNVITHVPESRWKLLRGTEEDALRNTTQNCQGGFLTEISAFDPYFFGMTPREAMHVDPQHRLMMEVAYEAFEDAGVTAERLDGSNTGVFASLYASQFGFLQKDDPSKDTLIDALHIASGNAVSMAANRISYTFNLHGPSVVFDTACSSSLVALDNACKNLQNKTCDVALVSAVNINLLPSINLLLSKAKMLSPEGQCKTFDAQANGYVPGEGVCAVILKPLDKALQDNDRIYSVILGSAVNQDGKTNGLTAPNGLQQEAVIEAACESANIKLHEISYVECHGTGTLLGDPIEAQALGNVISQDRSAEQPCWIGSLKTNIGHLEPAAGLASIIKVSLALLHKQIPAHLNFTTPNPFIEFDKYHFRIPQELQTWPKYGAERLAGVSSFGFGGTNAHVILREAQDFIAKPEPTTDAQQLFILSAKDSSALKLMIDRWCEYLPASHNSLAALCYNLHLRRSHYFNRLAIIAKTKEELLSHLKNLQHKDLEKLETIPQIYCNLKKDKQVIESHSELESYAISYINRQTIDWEKLHNNNHFQQLDMPIYPWQHQDYWPELKTVNTLERISYPFLKEKVNSPLLQFQFMFDSSVLPELADTFYFLHAGYYLEMLTFAVKNHYAQQHFTLQDIVFSQPIAVPHDKPAIVQLILEKQHNQINFYFYSQTSNKKWQAHSSGIISLEKMNSIDIDIDVIKARCLQTGTSQTFLTRMQKMHIPSGGSIQWINEYWLNENEILAKLVSPVSQMQQSQFDLTIHPGIIDAAIQSLFMLLPDYCMKPYIATRIARSIIETTINHSSLYLYAKLTSLDSNGKHYTGNIYVMNVQGEIIFTFENITMTQLSDAHHLDNVERENLEKVNFDVVPLQERKTYIQNFLVDKVASIFSMPKKQIDIDRSLKDAGMDSLMAIVITQAIEAHFHLSFSIQQLLQDMTIADIANDILQMSSQELIEQKNPWIAYHQPSSKTKLRLFCFPYGGAGASIFSDWTNFLPDAVEVCPIQYPGREERINEKSYSEMNTLIDALCQNLKKDFNLPFVFFGHSMGALVAFELTRALRDRNMPIPQHLIISAFPDPRMPAKRFDNFLRELNEINTDFSSLTPGSYSTSEAGLFLAAKANHLQSETLTKIFHILKHNGLIEYDSKHANNTEIIKILLPIFMSDINIIKNYHYVDKPPLNIPITIFTGKQDSWLQSEDLSGWCHQTLQKCEEVQFDSEHLFIKDKKVHKEVLAKIATILLPLCNSQARQALNIPSKLPTQNG